MTNPNITTPDYRLERLATMKKLYPDLFTDEGELNVEELHALVHEHGVSVTEKFEFKWPGKSYAKKSAFTPSKARLLPQPERSVNFDTTQNVIIEGENLEVLKLLSKAYYNKIKCIYIDPPYNTGHDFVYNDDYSEGRQAYWEKNGVFRDGMKADSNSESSGRYHSNWLNMMLPRLTLAQMTLKDDGVIFVSIDDNEMHNLRKLMDEVFGEENFVAQFIWKRRVSSAMADNNVSADHDYVVCYQKGSLLGFIGDKKNYNKYLNPDNDPRGPWIADNLTVGMSASMRPNQAYDLVDPKTGNIFPPNPNRVWAFAPGSMKKMIEEGRIIFPNDAKKRPMQKRFKNELKSDSNPFSTIMIDKVGLNTEATRTIQDVMGGNMFDYSKPISLLKTLISQVCQSGDIVFDFFAGSGTTGQAVMELNQEDGGDRKFILTQLPEEILPESEAFKAGYKKISDITIERVKRAGERVQKEKPEVDTGFQVFKLTTSLFPENTYQTDSEKSEDENVVALGEYLEKIKQHVLFEPKGFETDLMYEILVKKGFMVTMKKEKLEKFTENVVWKVTDGNREALVCLDGDLKEGTIDLLEGTKDIQFVGLHRAVDTTKKWKMTVIFGESLVLV